MSCCQAEFDPAEATRELQRQYHRTRFGTVAPARIAPELVVTHDSAEAREYMDYGGKLWAALDGAEPKGGGDMLRGFSYAVKFAARTREEAAAWRLSSAAELVAVTAPEYNALVIKFFPQEDRAELDAYTADHHFVRREPEPGDGGADVIRQALARCQGCYDRGYHRAEVDISCEAFGVPAPAYPSDVSEEEVEKYRRWLAGGPSPHEA